MLSPTAVEDSPPPLDVSYRLVANKIGRDRILEVGDEFRPPPFRSSASPPPPPPSLLLFSSTLHGLTAPPNPLLAERLSPASALLRIQDPLALLGADRKDLPFVGELCGMCSPEEMVEKQKTSTANDLERLKNVSMTEDTEARMVNSFLAVKSFQRSDASKQFRAQDTRPAVWCRRTVHFLLSFFLNADISPPPYLYQRDRGEPFSYVDVYNFLRDRFRAVWQDLTVQHCCKHRAYIECLEISFRFLVLSEELLCERPREEFDSVQNSSLMTTCLDKLMTGYSDVRYFLQRGDADQFFRLSPSSLSSSSAFEVGETSAAGVEGEGEGGLPQVLVYLSPYEAEFWTYRILMSMSAGSGSSILDLAGNIPEELRNHPKVQFAMHVHQAFRMQNIRRYFQLLHKADYLMSILMNKFANFVRVRYLHLLSSAKLFKHSKDMPMSVFFQQFGWEGETKEAALAFIEEFNLFVDVREGKRAAAPLPSPFGAPSRMVDIGGGAAVEDAMLFKDGGHDLSSVFVVFTEAEVPSASDISNFKKLKTSRFQSRILQKKWEEQRLTRPSVLDPDYYFHYYNFCRETKKSLQNVPLHATPSSSASSISLSSFQSTAPRSTSFFTVSQPPHPAASSTADADSSLKPTESSGLALPFVSAVSSVRALPIQINASPFLSTPSPFGVSSQPPAFLSSGLKASKTAVAAAFVPSQGTTFSAFSSSPFAKSKAVVPTPPSLYTPSPFSRPPPPPPHNLTPSPFAGPQISFPATASSPFQPSSMLHPSPFVPPRNFVTPSPVPQPSRPFSPPSLPPAPSTLARSVSSTASTPPTSSTALTSIGRLSSPFASTLEVPQVESARGAFAVPEKPLGSRAASASLASPTPSSTFDEAVDDDRVETLSQDRLKRKRTTRLGSVGLQTGDSSVESKRLSSLQPKTINPSGTPESSSTSVMMIISEPLAKEWSSAETSLPTPRLEDFGSTSLLPAVPPSVGTAASAVSSAAIDVSTASSSSSLDAESPRVAASVLRVPSGGSSSLECTELAKKESRESEGVIERRRRSDLFEVEKKRRESSSTLMEEPLSVSKGTFWEAKTARKVGVERELTVEEASKMMNVVDGTEQVIFDGDEEGELIVDEDDVERNDWGLDGLVGLSIWRTSGRRRRTLELLQSEEEAQEQERGELRRQLLEGEKIKNTENGDTRPFYSQRRNRSSLPPLGWLALSRSSSSLRLSESAATIEQLSPKCWKATPSKMRRASSATVSLSSREERQSTRRLQPESGGTSGRRTIGDDGISSSRQRVTKSSVVDLLSVVSQSILQKKRSVGNWFLRNLKRGAVPDKITREEEQWKGWEEQGVLGMFWKFVVILGFAPIYGKNDQQPSASLRFVAQQLGAVLERSLKGHRDKGFIDSQGNLVQVSVAHSLLTIVSRTATSSASSEVRSSSKCAIPFLRGRLLLWPGRLADLSGAGTATSLLVQTNALPSSEKRDGGRGLRRLIPIYFCLHSVGTHGNVSKRHEEVEESLGVVSSEGKEYVFLKENFIDTTNRPKSVPSLKFSLSSTYCDASVLMWVLPWAVGKCGGTGYLEMSSMDVQSMMNSASLNTSVAEGRLWDDLSSPMNDEVWEKAAREMVGIIESAAVTSLSSLSPSESPRSEVPPRMMMLLYTLAVPAHLERQLVRFCCRSSGTCTTIRSTAFKDSREECSQEEMVEEEEEDLLDYDTLELHRMIEEAVAEANLSVKHRLLEVASKSTNLTSHQWRYLQSSVMPQCVAFLPVLSLPERICCSAATCFASVSIEATKTSFFLLLYPSGFRTALLRGCTAAINQRRIPLLERPVPVTDPHRVLTCIWKKGVEDLHAISPLEFQELMRLLPRGLQRLRTKLLTIESSRWALPPAEWRGDLGGGHGSDNAVVCRTLPIRDVMTGEPLWTNAYEDERVYGPAATLEALQRLIDAVSQAKLPEEPKDLRYAFDARAAFDVIESRFHEWVDNVVGGEQTKHIKDNVLWLPYSIWREIELSTTKPWNGLPYPPEVYSGHWSPEAFQVSQQREKISTNLEDHLSSSEMPRMRHCASSPCLTDKNQGKRVLGSEEEIQEQERFLRGLEAHQEQKPSKFQLGHTQLRGREQRSLLSAKLRSFSFGLSRDRGVKRCQSTKGTYPSALDAKKTDSVRRNETSRSLRTALEDCFRELRENLQAYKQEASVEAKIFVVLAKELKDKADVRCSG